MNNTLASLDLVSRCLPIQFDFVGRPEKREFEVPDPIAFIKEHREEILGELFGMVERWKEAGRPKGHESHRLHYWSSVVGGILDVAGLPEFLSNFAEATASFNEDADKLGTLAEAVVRGGTPGRTDEGISIAGSLSAHHWEPIFRRARLCVQELDACASPRGRATLIGQVLSNYVDRQVPIESNGRVGTAILRILLARSNEKRYYFEVAWNETNDTKPPPTPTASAIEMMMDEELLVEGQPAMFGNAEVW